MSKPALAPLRAVRGGLTLALVALLLTLLVAPGRAQEAPLELAVTPAFEGNYAPDRWLPLSIVLRNAGPPARVLVAAALPGARARNTAEVDLASGAEARLTLYAAMDRQARELLITAERDGQVLVEQRVAVRPREGERLLGIVAPQPLQLRLPRREELAALPFLPLAMPPEALPDRPAGLSSLTLQLLGELPAEGLGPAQQGALLAWVRSGGHLVVGGGPGAQTMLASLPPELRLAEAGSSADLDPAPLGAFAGGPPPDGLQGVILRPTLGAVASGPAAAPLWLQRAVGGGQVTQLAFDPGLPALQAWQGAPAFWNRLLQPVRIYATAGGDTSADGLQARILSGALGNLPAINLPNTGPLFALLALYTVVIGPGLALALNRLDRQALGWVVLPAVALGVGAIAAGMAIAGRPDQRIVSQITLIEQLDANNARARTALGILTPRDERFAVTAGANLVARPITPGSAPFGSIDGAGGDLAQESGDLSLDVQRWELQGVQAEALVPLAALDATLTIGDGTIDVMVRNTTGQPLTDVAVVYAGSVVRLGDLAPEALAQASWPPAIAPGAPRPAAAAPLSALVLGDVLAVGLEPGTAPERRNLIREALINAAVAPYPDGAPPGPVVLAWTGASPLSLAVDAPGAANQQVGLVISQPRIVGGGAAFIPAGWMLPRAEDGRGTCRGEPGRGLIAAPAPLTLTLALPAELAGFQAQAATIDLQSDRPWPSAGVTTELYRWQDAQWVALSFDGPGAITLSDAAPYVQAGRLRIRLGGRIAEAGCVFADASLRGTLP